MMINLNDGMGERRVIKQVLMNESVRYYVMATGESFATMDGALMHLNDFQNNAGGTHNEVVLVMLNGEYKTN